MMMNITMGSIVSLSFGDQEVLGVVKNVQAMNNEFFKKYLIISRTRLVNSPENLEKLKSLSMNEIYDFDESSRVSDEVELLEVHPEYDKIEVAYQNFNHRFNPMRTVDFVDSVVQEVKKDKLTSVERYALLDIANQKNVHNIVSEMLY